MSRELPNGRLKPSYRLARMLAMAKPKHATYGRVFFQIGTGVSRAELQAMQASRPGCGEAVFPLRRGPDGSYGVPPVTPTEKAAEAPDAEAVAALLATLGEAPLKALLMLLEQRMRQVLLDLERRPGWEAR